MPYGTGYAGVGNLLNSGYSGVGLGTGLTGGVGLGYGLGVSGLGVSGAYMNPGLLGSTYVTKTL